MVAKIAANGSGPIRHSDEDSGGLAGRLLAAAALLVVLVYGGTLAWLLLSDDRLAGEPVVHVALAPEEPVAPESPAEEETQTPLAEITPDEQEPPEGDVADLSADEQALLDAARNLDGGGETEGEVRIVGAESVSGDGGEETGSEGEVIRLDPVPDPALVEQTADGPLPKISRDGRKPWQVYARPVPSGTQSDRRIALVVSGMGISESATAHAIKVLPPEVTLSFAPYGAGLQEWIARARAAGHEVLLELPMEPFGYPQNDPGPHTLLTGGNTDENISRLEWLMSRFTGYTGVMNYQGARFTTSASALTPVMGALGARGLLYVDNGASARSLAPELAEKAGMPAVQATRIVDPVQNPEVIATSLDTLEDVAREKGSAVGVASGFPVTVDALVQWAASLKDEGYVLVPVTAIATDN
ncbi:MAG: divergent polysaccharide deacetylase family protein [Parvibaculum sp.]|uniref:divergent polysaccharide deacetylase family protein n=1 Tax=Parvibaculum sp. TaxID=2024848 RepID=UPI003262E7DF